MVAPMSMLMTMVRIPVLGVLTTSSPLRLFLKPDPNANSQLFNLQYWERAMSMSRETHSTTHVVGNLHDARGMRIQIGNGHAFLHCQSDRCLGNVLYCPVPHIKRRHLCRCVGGLA